MRILRIIFFILVLTPFIGVAQDNNVGEIDLISQQLMKNLRSTVKEKILLQTNKKVYAAEETIWFKVYTVDSVSNRLINRNKILYVDLVDAKDNILKHLLLNTGNAEQDGAMMIDASLGGYYWLRAYTTETNGNTNCLTVKPVYIINNEINKKENLFTATNDAATDGKMMLDLYPEGDELIGGANSVVAVHAHTLAGKGISVSGIVKDNRDTIVAKFSTNNEGLGKFSFSPSSYQKYKLYVLNNNQYDSIATLPRVNPFAAQLAVTAQTRQYITAQVLLEDSIYAKDYKTYVIGINKDSVCFASVGRGMYEFNIPVSNFPPGIASLLLFNSKKQLVSSRNIYINKTNINVEVSTNKQDYAERENVQVNINVNDATGKPLLATLAVSVTDSRAGDTINDFYNDPLAKLSADDADLIMLTHQHSNTTYWRNIYMGKDPPTTGYKEESLSINGILVNQKKEPLPGNTVTLMGGAEDISLLQDTTDASGRFSFQLADFNNGTPFNVQVIGEHGINNNYNLILDSLVYPKLSTPPGLKHKFSADELKSIKKIETFYSDPEVGGKAWLPPVTVEGSANKNKKGFNTGETITKEMLGSGVNNLGDVIIRSGKFHLSNGYLISGGPNAFMPSPSDEPAVILDGVQVSLSNEATADAPSPVLAYLKSFPANQIDRIRILTGASAGIYGVRSGHGVIEIYTTPHAANTVSSGNLKTIYPRGFDTAPAFGMPDYTNKQVKNSKNPDMRTTIYWNGNIITGNDGKAAVNFFTADAPATYIVTVSGITANGHRIFKTSTINRK